MRHGHASCFRPFYHFFLQEGMLYFSLLSGALAGRPALHCSEGCVANMAKVTLYKDSCADFTVVSNLFIDQYMGNANDAQLKVYLYLIRMLAAGKATSVSDIADKFNHTEKDVLRSLRYWEKQGLLTLEYDQDKNLCGIHVNSLSAQPKPAPSPVQTKSIVLSADTVLPFSPAAEITLPSQEETAARSEEAETRVLQSAEPVDAAPAPRPSFEKTVYTTEMLKDLKSRKNICQLVSIAEKYLGRTLSVTEMQYIFFFSDTLHFSDDLIVSLLEYCIERGKKDFKYIEKVAIRWAEDGITTPEEASQSSRKYDRNVYVIMNELGKTSSPTSKELEFIQRWTKEYAFPMEIILEACQRTVLATDKHRFEYADSILTGWRRDGVSTQADIERLDELHQKKKTAAKPAGKQATGTGKFGQFSQNDYDFDALAKKLISN